MALMKLLPRTMTGLVTAGCLFASLPLLIALVWADTELGRFKVRTENITNNGLVMAHLGNLFQDQIKGAERALRQYAVLNDASLVPAITSHLRDSQATLLRLESLSISNRLETGLDSSRRSLALLSQSLQSSPDEIQVQLLISASDGLRNVAQAVVEQGRAHTISELASLKDAALAAQRAIAISIVALIPLTAMLAYGFTRAITTPLRRMDRGLAELGYGRYKRPIVIDYPQEMQRLGSRLDWLRQCLSTLERDKDRFLRHVSHELKTPLASLEEGSALLLEGRLGTLTSRQEEVARIVSEATTELGKLIENLLAYAEWRRGDKHIEQMRFNATTLIEEVCDSYRLPMERKGLGFSLQIDAKTLHGQRARLKTALENLVSNAVKYAPMDSAIEITCRLIDGCFEITVRDHGLGVGETDQQRIFEPFFRGADAEASDIRGTGVGLSIVLETVKAHGGTIGVEDAKPGARFILKWPNKTDDPI